MWQHGNYTIHPNNSMTLQPFRPDGRQQVSRPCTQDKDQAMYYYQYVSSAHLQGGNHRALRDYDLLALRRTHVQASAVRIRWNTETVAVPQIPPATNVPYRTDASKCT